MILWISHGDGLGLARRISLDGHEVTVCLQDPFAREKHLYEGLLPTVNTIEEGLSLRPEAVIFDTSSMGERADAIGRYLPVWGAGVLQDKLEEDRGFGLWVMDKNGIRIPQSFVFSREDGDAWQLHARQIDNDRFRLHHVLGHIKDAIALVRATKRRFVVKPFIFESSAATYVASDANDMVEHLEVEAHHGAFQNQPFLLQEFVEGGIEISTEGHWQHGELLISSLNHTFETKKFMPDDYGPATGASTSVIWPGAITKIPSQAFPEPFLDWMKHPTGPDNEIYLPYHGMLDLNTIVSHGIAYGLEYTGRAGFGATFAMAEVMKTDLGTLFGEESYGRLKHIEWHSGFGTCIRVSVPPYPHAEPFARKHDLYRQLMEEATGIDITGNDIHTWLIDAKLKGGNLETAGASGIVAEVGALANTINESMALSEQRVKNLRVANKQARMLDGAARASKDYTILKSKGLL